MGTTYLTYLDDSGDQTLDILAAILVPVETWGPVINYWKHFRRKMYRQWQIPPSVEFHSLKILHRDAQYLEDETDLDPGLADDEHPNGQPRRYPYPASIELPDGQHTNREGLFLDAATRLAEMNTGDRQFGVRLIVAAAEAPNGSARLHAPMLDYLHDFLAETNSWAILWSDGVDPSKDAVLRRLHRHLNASTRRVLEDAVPRQSTHSHFIQMADLCAHAALRHVRHERGTETRGQVRDAFARLQPMIVSHPETDEHGVCWFSVGNE